MSAIRPLATIGMLVVLGYFLWTRINTPGLEQIEEPEIALLGAPPLSTESSLSGNLGEGSAPPFDATETPAKAPLSEATEKSLSSAPAATSPDTIQPLHSSAPDGMPELPPLPAHIPTADYSTASNSKAAASLAPANAKPPIMGQVPELGTQVGGPTDFSSLSVPPPPADTITAVPAPLAIPPALVPEPGAPAPPLGVGQEFAAPRSAFAAARTAIDAATARGDLKQAHLLLSNWYGDRSLTPEETADVDTLLSQLAGTVIYSTEHRLESPHHVALGETLESIAQSYQVPWQLLAKINGIADPRALAPGQSLKVLRGPFSAVVDVERQELALMVADRYAGRFTVKTEGEAARDGEWVVTQKSASDSAGNPAKQVVLGSGSTTGVLVLGATAENSLDGAGALHVSPSDGNDLFDILSIGSKVIIRR